MKYFLKTQEALPDGLQRIAAKLLDTSSSILVDRHISIETAVHKARKASKKLRALLRLVATALPRKTYRGCNRTLRDFSRQLEGARDSAARMAALQQIESRFDSLLQEAATQPVAVQLHEQHQRALQQHLENLNTAQALRTLQAVTEKLDDVDWSAASLETLIAGLGNDYRRGRCAMQRLHEQPTTDNSHDLRKYVKIHWYQLRLLQKWNPESLQPRIQQLDALGALLGQDHDLALLNAALGKLPACRDNPERHELLKGLIETRRITLLSRSIQSAHSLYSAKTGKFIGWFESIQRQP